MTNLTEDRDLLHVPGIRTRRKEERDALKGA